MTIKSSKLIWGLYSLTILSGAFLMFLVQPLAGKMITPQYGGVSQVWCLCLLFFQTALLGGYAITWGLSHVKPKTQGLVYLGLMLVSVLLVHPPIGDAWAPHDVNAPVQSLFWALMMYLAVPCVLLSTISTMMQNWFAVARLGDPYSLYSISNIGSMGALLAYPLLIEPHSTVSGTVHAWTMGYWGLVALACLSAVVMIRFASQETAPKTAEPEPDAKVIPKSRYAWWVGLSAAGSILLMTFTNHVTHDIAPIPFMWVIPLCAYLLTFIVCFSGERFYPRTLLVYLAQLTILLCFLGKLLPDVPLQGDIAMNLLAMFLFCMICHGEVYARRPEPKRLSVFYLMIALGGALGGVLVNLVSPAVFSNFYEFNLIIIGMLLFCLWLMKRFNLRLFYHVWMDQAYALALVAILAWFGYVSFKSNPSVVVSQRNFYGAVNVSFAPARDMLVLNNGTTIHGAQLIDPKAKRMVYTPTTYYMPNSGFGVSHALLQAHRHDQPLEIAAIGLGAGTVATYGRPGDHYTFFEIDPKIKQIAENDFRFLKDSRAGLNVVLGDARLSLQRDRSGRQYDLMLVDAFSGDSIPLHLLTQEAIRVYLSHLKPDGVLLFHVSNRYLALPFPLTNLARHFGMDSTIISSAPLVKFGLKSEYIALAKPGWFPQALRQPDFHQRFPNVHLTTLNYQPDVGIWSDDYSNLFSIFMRDWADFK